ncbi:MAG: virulence RhuM family protein [Paludibacteraceae bacterium]|nr:virulence RhuM family protein [Paludibacteraceae bacterium]
MLSIYVKNEIVLYQPDNTIQLEVRLQDETVWLSQQQMVALFESTKQNVSLHINNIYKEGELQKAATVKEYLTVQNEGGRQVTRRVQYYNLDVIISVGYRVKSKRGTQFRQWALKIIKDYLLRGYAVNQRLAAVEDRIDRRLHSIENTLQDHQEKIDFFVRTSLPPVEQVFYNGQFFEARVLLERIIKTAQKRVVIIDAYVDAATFEMLDVRAKGVQAIIYSGKDLNSLRDLHNAKDGAEPVETAVWKNASHDRWLIVDDSVYHCGHSLKDMGQKLSAVSLLGIDAEDVIKKVK